MGHSPGAHPPGHPSMSAQAAMVAAFASNGIPPSALPTHSTSGAFPSSVVPPSSTATSANLLSLPHPTGLLPPHPFASNMFGIRGVVPGTTQPPAFPSSKDELKRSTSSGCLL